MRQKIELLLQVAADYLDFCAETELIAVSSCTGEELTELDLEMVSAAAKSPLGFAGNTLSDKG